MTPSSKLLPTETVTQPLELGSAPERILIVRLSHLGDVIHGLPLFHHLRAHWPKARIAWAVQPGYGRLLEGMAGLERCVPFDRHGGLRAWWRLRRELREFRPDLAVDAQGNLKSAAVLLASGARRRVGLHPTDWREKLGAYALTDHAPAARAPHAVDLSIQLASWITGTTGVPRCDPLLTATELEGGRLRLADLVGSGSAPVVIQLGRQGDPRSWTVQHYRDCATQLVARGQTVILVSGPAEIDLGTALQSGMAAQVQPPDGTLTHAREDRGPRATAALFTAVAERRGHFVGCDSGPLHLAAAVGLRCMLLAGPQDPARTGPYGRLEPPHRVLRSENGPDCRPCLQRHCDHPRGPVCLSELRPEQVVLAIGEPPARSR